MNKKNYKENIFLFAPEPNEPDDCRERIFLLIEKLQSCSETAQNKSKPQNSRDFAIHEIKYIAKRLLWETGA